MDLCILSIFAKIYHMSFLAKISQTAQGKKEKKSVHFIERLLEDHPVHDKIETP